MAVRKKRTKKRKASRTLSGASSTTITPKKVLVATMLAGGASAAIYFGMKSRKETAPMLPSAPLRTSSSALKEGSFPVKLGDRNRKVLSIQQALLSRGGTAAQAISTTGGADGSFGGGLAKALSIAGYPSIIDQATYNRILSGSSSSSGSVSAGTSTIIDATSIAQEIYNSATASRIRIYGVKPALDALKKIRNVSEYKVINEKHKSIGWPSSTIVTRLLTAAFSESEKEQIRAELKRVGLAYDAATDRWQALGRLPFRLPRQVVTKASILIKNTKGKIAPVAKKKILGYEIARNKKSGMSRILTINNKIIHAPGRFIKPV